MRHWVYWMLYRLASIAFQWQFSVKAVLSFSWSRFRQFKRKWKEFSWSICLLEYFFEENRLLRPLRTAETNWVCVSWFSVEVTARSNAAVLLFGDCYIQYILVAIILYIFINILAFKFWNNYLIIAIKEHFNDFF